MSPSWHDYLGAPHRKAGSPGEFGPAAFSCWGLVWWLYHESGVTLPQDPLAARPFFVEVDRPLQAWDIVRFELAGTIGLHVGVMEDALAMVQCSASTGGVSREFINRSPWKSAIQGFLRLKEWV